MTCPTMRIHPAILAQADGDVRPAPSDGRFTWGVGTGEALNEHILGDRWPPRRPAARDARGGRRGRSASSGRASRYPPRQHYTVENARLYDPPDPRRRSSCRRSVPRRPSSRRASATACGSPAPTATPSAWREAGGTGPVYAQLTLCWAGTRRGGRDRPPHLAEHRRPGQLSQDLPTPAHFEQARRVVTEEQIAESMAVRARPRTGASAPSRSDRRRRSTTSTSTRSAPTRKGSAGSGASSWSPRLPGRGA